MRDRDREKRSKFKYRETDKADAARVTSAGGGYDSIVKRHIKQWKCGEGKNRVRVLPRTWGDDEGPRHWGYEAFVHYGVGADNSTYLCPEKMKGEKCPICTERVQLAQTDPEAAKELRAAKVVLVWIIDRRAESEGPQLWRMPAQKVAQEVQMRSDTADGAMMRIDHPERGYDITFTRTGSNRNVDYVGVDIARKPSPISEDSEQMDEWLEFISENPIPKALNYYSEEHLAKVFGGGVSAKDEDEDDEEDEEPKRRSSKYDDDDEEEAPKRSSKRSDADDEEDDEDEDDEPKRSSKSKRRDDEDEEDEDEEESEDEDDEEEAPKRSSKSKRRDDDEDEEEDDEDDDLDDLDEPDDEDEEDEKPKKKGGLRESVREGMRKRRDH